jgi:hypothetical protein
MENLEMIKIAGDINFIYVNGCQSGRRRAPFRKKDLHFRMRRHLKVNYTNNKRYFKNYRQINNYTVSTVTSDFFLIEGIEIIQLKIFISEEIKVRF